MERVYHLKAGMPIAPPSSFWKQQRPFSTGDGLHAGVGLRVTPVGQVSFQDSVYDTRPVAPGLAMQR